MAGRPRRRTSVATAIGGDGAHRDVGATMTEVVVAIALLAIVVVPVLGGVFAATKASARARAAATVETALINAVDRVNRADDNLCDYLPYARAAVLTQGWTTNEVAVSHAYLDTETSTWVQGPPAAAACPDGVHRPGLIQRVTITVTDPDGNISRSLQVVKSNV